MFVQEADKRFYLLGDPHLGRQFVNGVPLHRRGEREAMVWKDFDAALSVTDVDFHVNMGDLFDKWLVSYDVMMRAAEAYRAAAEANPRTNYIVLKGNHDWIKDLERASAFDVFAGLVRDVSNIYVCDQPTWSEPFAFFPWHPTDSADFAVQRMLDFMPNIVAAFGHWDTEFGDHNMVPTKADIPTFYTGHIHKPTEFTRDGSRVVVVGSMQPYAHGEEADDSLYVTLDKAEGDLSMKCVRLTEQPDGPVDCLQLTVQPKDTNDRGTDSSVSIGDFDMEALFREAFQDAGVPEGIAEKVLGQYQAKRVASHA